METILIVFLAIIALFLYLFLRVELRYILTYSVLALIIYMLSFTVAEMPTFGNHSNPSFNEVGSRYIERGVNETGALNITSSIITDYRAFDTLGEATVLFVAIAAVIATLGAHRRDRGEE